MLEIKTIMRDALIPPAPIPDAGITYFMSTQPGIMTLKPVVFI